MLLLPVGLAAVLVVSRVLVVSELTGRPRAAADRGGRRWSGCSSSRDRLRAMRFDRPGPRPRRSGWRSWSPRRRCFSGEPTFTGSLVLGDTAHQLTLADRLGEAGTHSQPLPNSSYELSVRKYFVTAYPMGPQAALGLLSPLGLLDLAWLYQPFLAIFLAATALSLNGVARPRAGVAPAAGAGHLRRRPAGAGGRLRPAGLDQGDHGAGHGLAHLRARGAGAGRALAGTRVPDARAVGAGHRRRARARRAGVRGPAAADRCGGVGAAAAQGRRCGPRSWRRAGWSWPPCCSPCRWSAAPPRPSRPTTRPSPPATQLGNLARPLDLLQAIGRLGGRRLPLRAARSPRPPPRWRSWWSRSAVLGLVMAIRRRALGPLLLAGVLVAALRRCCCSAATLTPTPRCSCWPRSWCRCWRCSRPPGCSPRRSEGGGFSGERWRCWWAGWSSPATCWPTTTSSSRPTTATRSSCRSPSSWRAAGPVVFAEYDEFAKHFMRRTQVLSQPEWPFEFPIGPLNVKGAATHVEENRDGLHPSFKAPLDPDGITPVEPAEGASFIVIRRSPTASRPPANYRLIRTRALLRGLAARYALRASSCATSRSARRVFQPAARAQRCSLVKSVARTARAAGRQAGLAWSARRSSSTTPSDASSNNAGLRLLPAR